MFLPVKLLISHLLFSFGNFHLLPQCQLCTIIDFSALTLEDEKRMLAYLINGFIKMVSIGEEVSVYLEM